MKTQCDIIALDLDDTLLDHDLAVSDRNRRAIEKAGQAGIHVVLASGRNIHSMERYVNELGLTGRGGYLICTNGAEILEIDGHKVIYERKINGVDCREITDFVEERGFPYQMYVKGKIYVSKKNEWTEKDTILTGQPNVLVEDPEPFFREGQLKFVIPGEPEALAVLEQALKDEFGSRFQVFRSKPYFLEILGGGVDKGVALAELARILHVDRSRVLAVGDAMNDFGMLSWAGIPCCPANAIPAIRDIVRHISPFTNAEDAVADIIGKFAFFA